MGTLEHGQAEAVTKIGGNFIIIKDNTFSFKHETGKQFLQAATTHYFLQLCHFNRATWEYGVLGAMCLFLPVYVCVQQFIIWTFLVSTLLKLSRRFTDT